MNVVGDYDPATNHLTVDLGGIPAKIIVLYDESQVAEMFGVTLYTVRYWRREGVIPHILVNRTVRFTQEQLQEFIENNSIPASRTLETRVAKIS